MKTQVLEAIGERDLQPAAELNAALAANDRLKYYFSLLQTALNHADRPEPRAATLRGERIACGIDDAGLDAVVAATRKDGLYDRVPGCAKVMPSTIAIADADRLFVAAFMTGLNRTARLKFNHPAFTNFDVALIFIRLRAEALRGRVSRNATAACLAAVKLRLRR